MRHTRVAECAWNRGYYIPLGNIRLLDNVSLVEFMPLYYLHARRCYRRRFRSLLLRACYTCDVNWSSPINSLRLLIPFRTTNRWLFCKTVRILIGLIVCRKINCTKATAKFLTHFGQRRVCCHGHGHRSVFQPALTRFWAMFVLQHEPFERPLNGGYPKCGRPQVTQSAVDNSWNMWVTHFWIMWSLCDCLRD